MANELVVKDNILINASYNLELTEQRLILLAIVEARETGQGITAESKLQIHAQNYANRFDVTKEAAYNALKNAVSNLFDRQFSFKEEHEKTGKIGIVRSRWVSRIKYIDDLALLEITFAPDVVPFITRLEKHFTSYQLNQISQLTSKYAIRTYELLIAWRTVGKCSFDLEDFRNKIGLGVNEYTAMSDFKKRVLEPAIKQINEHTDITVTYEQHKKGRTISGFSFSFKQKKKQDAILKEKAATSILTKMTDSQRHLFANKLSRLPEMNSYSEGTESFEQFAIRIAEMLTDPIQLQKLLPYLKKVGYKSSGKKI